MTGRPGGIVAQIVFVVGCDRIGHLPERDDQESLDSLSIVQVVSLHKFGTFQSDALENRAA